MKVVIFCFLCFLSLTRSILLPVDSIHKMPKIELHAHLHGSIRKTTLIELANKNGLMNKNIEGLYSSPRNIDTCFQIFDIIHHIIQSKDSVSRILTEALEDFMNENVIYLELRTTPRPLSDGTTREQYINLIIQQIKEHNIHNGHRMQVRLLLSIDRSKSISEANEVIQHLIQYTSTSTSNESSDNVLVGIDFSGNPSTGSFKSFQALLEVVRERKFPITIHCGEVPESQSPSQSNNLKSNILESNHDNNDSNSSSYDIHQHPCMTVTNNKCSEHGEIDAIISF
eukprot:gene10929-22815_t